MSSCSRSGPPRAARSTGRSGTRTSTSCRCAPSPATRARRSRRPSPRDNLVVDWAMRYGQPSIASRIDALLEQGCDRLLIFPLYPAIFRLDHGHGQRQGLRCLEAVALPAAMRTVPPYPTDPVYIEAVADSIRAHLGTLDLEPEVILASFHGLPRSYVDKGDPYYDQCALPGAACARRSGPSARS